MAARPFSLLLRSGRLQAQRWGDPAAPLVLCVPGLSAHMHAFDVIGPRIAADGQRHVVALDLRGRGRSDVTGPGTYGLHTHSDDLLDAADALEALTFDLVGWSMGAMIGIELAAVTPARVRRLALLDAAGPFDRQARAAVVTGLRRLDEVSPDADAYVNRMRALSPASPWGPFWETYYRYELTPGPGPVTPTTSRMACLEDLEVADLEGVKRRWQHLTMPTLLVRCLRPLADGHFVPREELADLRTAVPHLEVVEIEHDHYSLMADAATAATVGGFLLAGGITPMMMP